MPRRKRPTPKQKAFIKEFIKNGGNARRAIMASYDVNGVASADTLAKVTLRSPIVQNYMSQLLGKIGLTEEYEAEALKSVVDAGLKKRNLRKTKSADVLRAVELSSRLKGNLIERKQVDQRTLSLTANAEGKNTLEQLQELQKEISGFIKLLIKDEEARNRFNESQKENELSSRNPSFSRNTEQGLNNSEQNVVPDNI